MSSVAPSLSSDVSLVSDRILACLKRPGASNDDRLELIEQGLRCVQTGDVFLFIDGVPSLLAQDRGDGEDVTARVKSFYESHPFPSYEGLEGFGELVTKGNRNSFSVDLLNAIGFNKTILECGCGTGQLSQFLQINNNHVLGVDLSLSSLHLAVEHKWRNGLPRSSFAQMDLFDLAIKDDQELIYVYSENDFDPRTPFGTPEEAVTWLKAFAAEQGQRRATIVYSPYIYNIVAQLTRFRGYRGDRFPHHNAEKLRLKAAAKTAGIGFIDFTDIALAENQAAGTMFAALGLFIDHAHSSRYGTAKLVARLRGE